MAYKGFSFISPSTPKPWGPVEEQNWKDMADTLLLDCVTQARDVANGHRHKSIYNLSGGTTAIAVDANKMIGIQRTSAMKRWQSYATTLQFQNGFTVAESVYGMGAVQGELSNNAYYDHTDYRWEYVADGKASLVSVNAGELSFAVSPTGTADGAITWAPKLVIDSDGCDIRFDTAYTSYGEIHGEGYISTKDKNGSTIYLMCRTQIPT